MQQAFLFVLLLKGGCAGNSVTDVDRSHIVEVHLCSEEADHATDMRDHTTGKQTRNDATSKPATFNESLVDMVGVVVACDATEQTNIAFGEGPPKSKSLTHLYGIKGRFELLLEFWCCAWHSYSL